MYNYGPEEFTLTNGKRVVIKTWDVSQLPQLEEIFDLFVKERAYIVQKDEAHQMVEEIGKRWKTDADSTSQVFLGVHDGDKMIAYATLRRTLPDRPWENHIGTLGLLILEDYWSQGLGNKLLEILESLAKKFGLTRLEAKIRVKNQRGSNLFIRNRYQIEGKRHKAAFINGAFEDEYFLAKNFGLKNKRDAKDERDEKNQHPCSSINCNAIFVPFVPFVFFAIHFQEETYAISPC